ncbi:hypothetical protein M8C21_014349 [Ambrosia artemisiifolia]|uniref:FBD domain-containing protein n=1 Tax=Ambrosia artemisiifolia TaxID=4212 RepID=A0AAD5BPX6_AMBAR|nr:hypothetical protein M8C21_014349 [Ambrosia artemisiifolia]
MLWLSDEYKLPPAFFNLQQLTVLKLHNCAFRPPETFSGFSRLVKLLFNKVSITAKDFLWLISNCPRLEALALIGDENHLLGCWNSNFVELFERLPLLKHLLMSAYPIKCFATGFMPKKLPTSLVHLKYLHLHRLRFGREVDFLCALSLVASFNVEITEIEMEDNPTEAMSQIAMNLIDHYNSFVILDHLRVIRIRNFTNTKIGMDFVKLILAKSPMLKKVDIYINHQVDINGELKIVKELIRYPRASAKAEIMIKKPTLSV